jgi:hypothetical protein
MWERNEKKKKRKIWWVNNAHYFGEAPMWERGWRWRIEMGGFCIEKVENWK